MASERQRYDPFQQAMSLRDAMDRLLRESFVSPGMMFTMTGEVNLPLDVLDAQDSYVVHASLPGLKPEDVQINLQGDTLSIRGQPPQMAEEKGKGKTYLLRERQQVSYARSITLPGPIDADRASAQFEHGVLTLTLPKAEAARPKTIKIGSAAQR
jgi:HSP20 family protein